MGSSPCCKNTHMILPVVFKPFSGSPGLTDSCWASRAFLTQRPRPPRSPVSPLLVFTFVPIWSGICLHLLPGRTCRLCWASHSCAGLLPSQPGLGQASPSPHCTVAVYLQHFYRRPCCPLGAGQHPICIGVPVLNKERLPRNVCCLNEWMSEMGPFLNEKT